MTLRTSLGQVSLGTHKHSPDSFGIAGCQLPYPLTWRILSLEGIPLGHFSRNIASRHHILSRNSGLN